MDRYGSDPWDFWANRWWVEDDEHENQIFLARALLKIGEMLHREEWQGNEPEISNPRALPIVPRLPPLPPPNINSRVINGRVSETPTPTAHVSNDGPWWLSGSPLGSPEEDAAQTEEIQRIKRELDGARARWAEVLSATAFFLRRDVLQSSLRGLRGGGYMALTRQYWNGEEENIWPRFQLCRMDDRQPFDRVAEGPAFIFISARPLLRLLQTLDANHPKGPTGWYELPPQLQDAASPSNEPLQNAKSPNTSKRGAKPKPVWSDVYAEVLQWCRWYGYLGQDQKGWENQAAVERKVTQFLEDRGFPSVESTVRRHTSKALAEAWATIEAEKADNSELK